MSSAATHVQSPRGPITRALLFPTCTSSICTPCLRSINVHGRGTTTFSCGVIDNMLVEMSAVGIRRVKFVSIFDNGGGLLWQAVKCDGSIPIDSIARGHE